MLLVIDGLYIAGAQRHVLELLDVFNECNVSCTVLALEGGGKWADQFITRAEQVVLAGGDPLSWASLCQLVGYSDFKFVSAQLSEAVRWVTYQVPSGIQALAHFHSEPSEHEVISGEWIYSVADRFSSILFPSSATLERFQKEIKSNDKLRILPNGMPRQFESGSPKNCALEAMRPELCVAVVSRIDADKFSVPLFIETALRLLRRYQSVEFRVAGNGECVNDLLEAIGTAGISDFVTLLGFVDDVAAVYSWADIVFLPSKREGMPYVFLECMAAKRPLVVPRLGFFRDFVSCGAVFPFAPGSASEGADAIHSALASSKLGKGFDGNGSLRGILNFSDWSQLVKEVYQLV
jgi:glycosyltransferase involved in cell wall biosynthesis